jgi:LacI family transcriptional regulator
VKRKRVTITNVANCAGVSVTTASRVINNKQYVSPETRQKVEAAIAKLNFKPDQNARVMRGMPSKLVALIIPDILNVYYTTLSKEIEKKLQEKGYTMLLGITHDQPELLRAYLEKISNINIDGLIYVPPPGPETSPFVRSLVTTGINIIEINRRREKDLFSGVEADNFGAVVQALEHLYSLGHRKIGFIVGSEQTSTGAQRLEGYHYFLSKYKISPIPELIKIGEFSREFGELATREILNITGKNQPTAIFPTSNRLLMGTMTVIKEAGINVPDDLSLIAMDDAEWLEAFSPSITTVDVAIEEMASLTVDLIIQQIDSEEKLEIARTYTLSTSLKIRNSCKHIDT